MNISRDREETLNRAASAQIQEAERLFRETGNPLLAWHAISICRGTAEHFEHVKKDLPEWVQEYLGEVARDFDDLGHFRDPVTRPQKDRYSDAAEFRQALTAWKNDAINEKGNPKLSARIAMERVPRALRFVYKGSNRLKQYFDMLRNINYAFLSLFPEEEFFPEENLLDEIKKRHIIDQAAAQVRIRKGRKLCPDLNLIGEGKNHEKR